MRLPRRRPRRPPDERSGTGAPVARAGRSPGAAHSPGAARTAHDDAGRVARLLQDITEARAELDQAVLDLRRRPSGSTFGQAESHALSRGRALDAAIVAAVFDAARPPAEDVARCARVDDEYLVAIRARLGA